MLIRSFSPNFMLRVSLICILGNIIGSVYTQNPFFRLNAIPSYQRQYHASNTVGLPKTAAQKEPGSLADLEETSKILIKNYFGAGQWAGVTERTFTFGDGWAGGVNANGSFIGNFGFASTASTGVPPPRDNTTLVTIDMWRADCDKTTRKIYTFPAANLSDLCMNQCRSEPNCAFVSVDKVVVQCTTVPKDAVCKFRRDDNAILLGDSSRKFETKNGMEYPGYDLKIGVGNVVTDWTADISQCQKLCAIYPPCNAVGGQNLEALKYCFLKQIPANYTAKPASMDKYQSFVVISE